MQKKILDACCGSRMMWFDHKHPSVVYADIREETCTLSDGRTIDVKPDLLMDFRKMPFADNTFRLVVFDPPHLRCLGKKSDMGKKYGKLFPSWEDDIKAGFDECMRVLEIGGVLIFKWNEYQIPVARVLEAVGHTPLFGHTTDSRRFTHWMTFMKLIPEQRRCKSL